MRPAPSPDALRILRQLAYIGSGTLAGVGVLVAEERRRRICTATRIVENKRRLRSCEQWIGNRGFGAAAAAVKDGYEEGWNASGQLHLHDGWSHDQERRTPDVFESKLFDLGAIRADVLPSQVEKSYHHVRNQDVQDADPLRRRRRSNKLSRQSLSSDPRQDQSIRHSAGSQITMSSGQTTRKGNSAVAREDTFRKISVPKGNKSSEDAKSKSSLIHLNAPSSEVVNLSNVSANDHTIPDSAIEGQIEEAHVSSICDSSRDSAQVKDAPENDAKNAELHMNPVDPLSPLPVEIEQIFDDILLRKADGNIRPQLIAELLKNKDLRAAVYNRSRKMDFAQKVYFPIGFESALRKEKITYVKSARVVQFLALKVCHKLLTMGRGEAAVKFFCTAFGLSPETATMGPSTIWEASGVLPKLLDASLRGDLRTKLHTSILCSTVTVKHSPEMAFTTVRAYVLDEIEQGSIANAAEALFSLSMDGVGRMGLPELSDEILQAALNAGILEVAAKILAWSRKNRIRNTSAMIQRVVDFCLQSRYTKTSKTQEISTKQSRFEGEEESDLILKVASACQGRPFATIALLRAYSETNPAWARNATLVEGFGRVFRRIRRETSDFSVLQYLYEHLLSTSEGQGGLPVSFVNSWMTICIKAQRRDEACRCVRYLQREGGPGADIGSFGAVMYDRAIAGVWPTVEVMLQAIYEEGKMAHFSRACYEMLNDLVHEYLLCFGADKGFEFLKTIVQNYGVEPSARLSNTFLQRCVQERQWERITEWFHWLNSSGIELRMDSQSVMLLMKQFSLRFRPPRRLLMSMLYRLRAKRKPLVSKQLVSTVKAAVGLDARSGVTNPKIYYEPEAMRRWKANVQGPIVQLNKEMDNVEGVWDLMRKDYGGVNDPMKLGYDLTPPDGKDSYDESFQLEMGILQKFSLSLYAKTVKIYRDMVSVHGLQSSSRPLEIALEASLRANSGDATEARMLLQEAEEAGMNVNAIAGPLLLRRIHQEKQDPLTLTKTVLRYYQAVHSIDNRPKHFIGTAAADQLIDRGHPREAIELLGVIYHSKFTAKVKLDIVSMTIFLKAYARLGDLQGVRWVLDTVFKEDMIIDDKFSQMLYIARRPLVKLRNRMDASQEQIIRANRALHHIDNWRTLLLEKWQQQHQRTVEDSQELLRVIEDLTPGYATDDDLQAEIELVQDDERMAQLAGWIGPFPEPKSDPYAMLDPKYGLKIRPKMTDPFAEVEDENGSA